MAAAAAAMQVIGTVLQAKGQYDAGKAANKASKYEAAQLNKRAGERFGEAQREGMEIERQGRLQQSRALAVAAASGGGASDPTVVNLMSSLAGETQYRKMTALYEGQSQADLLKDQAKMTRWEGKRAKKAGRMAAFSTLLNAGSSMYSKYGFKK